MKTTLNLFIILFFLTSCQKEINETVSENKSDYEGWFSNDIEVWDNDGINSAYFTIYAKTEPLLEDFMQKNHLTLFTNTDDDLLLKSDMVSNSIVKPNDTALKYYNVTDEPSIIISHITSNLVEGNTSFQLKVENNYQKSSNDWIHGSIYGYETTNSFIGLVHWQEPYEVIVHHRWKQNMISFWQHNDVSYWVGNFGVYWYKFDWGSVYKRGLTVRHHLYQQDLPYYMAYNSFDFRGNICEIGSWDSRNCYVGAPPVGTTAFMYPNNQGRFYYSALAGNNKCPLAGSWFDGYNCAYLDIPEDKTYGFIWDNKWYVAGNKILTY